MIIHLMRHPATGAAGGLCIGRTDAPLSSEGAASLEAFAVIGAELKPDRILCSNLSRCRILAEAVAKRISVPVSFDAAWTEIDFGLWENRTWDEIRKNDFERFEKWAAEFNTLSPPEGESFPELQKRIVEAFRQLDHGCDERLLIITHAGVIRALLCALHNRPNRQAFDIPVPYGSVTTLDSANFAEFTNRVQAPASLD